jgi:hypothetical protein
MPKGISISASPPGVVLKSNSYVEDWSSPVMYVAHLQGCYSRASSQKLKSSVLIPPGMYKSKSIVNILVIIRDALE